MCWSENIRVTEAVELNAQGRIMRALSYLLVWAGTVLGLGAAETQIEPTLSPQVQTQRAGIWQSGVGEGFQRDAESFSTQLGAGFGLKVFGSEQAHNLALLNLSYGHIWGPVRAQQHWFRGNTEVRVEFFTGAQYSPGREWLVGLTPHLRYCFATGSRWVPFVDGGVGVSATSIGPPDLSNTFEFNLHGSVGCHWFVKENVALTFEARYFHMSCADISKPNLGVNCVMAVVGLTWYF